MKPFRRVVAIGFDGMDPQVVEGMQRRGRLPNFSRLAEQGSYSRLATTWPAQTPVAWSTFATGVNPGGHGIFDFLRRDPATYSPQFGLTSYERRGSLLPARVVNHRRGTPVWETLGEAGIPSVILRCPCTYPPGPFPGRILAGMGVPDVRGGLGTATVFSTAPDERAAEAERVVRLEGGPRTFTASVIGPVSSDGVENFTAALRIDVDGESTLVWVGDTPVPVLPGVWSDWVTVRFRHGRFRRCRGVLRLLLTSRTPHLVLYASAVNFDPSSPVFPVSHPAAYSADLAALIGTYGTAGLIEDHSGLTNGRFGYEAFLEHCRLAFRERAAMLDCELGRLSDGLLFCLFDTPDRIQHMFWRFGDKEHPANRRLPEAGGDFTRVIAEHMQECDSLVGRLLDQVDRDTLLLVASDHGFASFRRGVHLNGWLRTAGLLAVKSGTPGGAASAGSLADVDWPRTSAYAVGLGSIYLNVRGREAQGAVDPDDAAALADRIARALTGLKDPEHGEVAVLSARSRRDVYHGAFASEGPDVLVGCARGYRPSWSTALGGVTDTVFEDNDRPWSGDHIMEPSQVPGVLYANAPLKTRTPNLLDLAPTILAALGCRKTGIMEGEDLLQATRSS
jgi:predicted AlkP superfamily phosphohydrolase/phosphomutase